MGEHPLPTLCRNRMTTLSTRQKEVLRLRIDGKCDKEIAGALRLSIATVRNHRRAAFKKLATTDLLKVGWLLAKENMLA